MTSTQLSSSCPRVPMRCGRTSCLGVFGECHGFGGRWSKMRVPHNAEEPADALFSLSGQADICVINLKTISISTQGVKPALVHVHGPQMVDSCSWHCISEWKPIVNQPYTRKWESNTTIEVTSHTILQGLILELNFWSWRKDIYS